jgi:hypothetical protein
VSSIARLGARAAYFARGHRCRYRRYERFVERSDAHGSPPAEHPAFDQGIDARTRVTTGADRD